MDNNEKELKVMQATIKTVFTLLEKRQSNSIEALNALSTAPMDNLPEKVREMRENEASKIRAVLQEQKDLLTILKALFPDG